MGGAITETVREWERGVKQSAAKSRIRHFMVLSPYLVFATVLTLVAVPSLYLIVYDIRSWFAIDSPHNMRQSHATTSV